MSLLKEKGEKKVVTSGGARIKRIRKSSTFVSWKEWSNSRKIPLCWSNVIEGEGTVEPGTHVQELAQAASTQWLPTISGERQGRKNQWAEMRSDWGDMEVRACGSSYWCDILVRRARSWAEAKDGTGIIEPKERVWNSRGRLWFSKVSKTV